MTKNQSKIVSPDHGALRQPALEVPPKDISSPRIKKIIADMKRALAAESDGIGLAAPQIGRPVRIFIVAKEAAERPEDLLSAETEKGKSGEALVFINPRLAKLSKEKEYMEEGCLSLRWLYGKVRRSKKASVTAYDEAGRKFTRGASGLLAHIFQHEIDHLDGILFTDKAKNVQNLPPAV